MWVVFGLLDYIIIDDLKIIVGFCYLDDEKEFLVDCILSLIGGSVLYFIENLSDDYVSWDLFVNYKINDDVNWYVCVVNSFCVLSI